jgi:CelD/BcsL family acetyltransferase involved in cellulose biosynthesis
MFAEGYRSVDMGKGLTEEKRHWCNVQIPVRHHYVPITRRGAIAASRYCARTSSQIPGCVVWP